MAFNGKKRLVLVGAGGMLAKAVADGDLAAYDLIPLDLPDFDLTRRADVLHVLTDLQPDLIINCAGYTNVDGCEVEEESARRVNGEGPGYLAEAALQTQAVLVHVSTDYVFDGETDRPYTEEVVPHPRSAYGRSKLIGEQKILQSGLEQFYIVRTSWLFGPGGNNFVETILRLAREHEELQIVSDQFGSPTYTRDLAAAIFRLVHDKAAYGIYHFSNEGECSWYEFAVKIVELAKSNIPLIVRRILPVRTVDYPLPACRPAYSVLSKRKFGQATGSDVLAWQDALKRYLAERN